MENAENIKRVRFADEITNSNSVKESIRFQTLQDVFHSSQIAITQKKKTLEEEENELNELHAKVWRAKDTMYDNFWRFSNSHDFDFLMTKLPKKRVRCFCSSEEEEKQAEEKMVSKSLQDPEVLDMKSKIEKLEDELEKLQSDKTIDQEIEKLKLELVNSYQSNNGEEKLKGETSCLQIDLQLKYTQIEAETQQKMCQKPSQSQDLKKTFEEDFYHSISSLFANEDSFMLENMINENEKEHFEKSIEESIVDNSHDKPNYVPNPQIYGFVKARTLYLENKQKFKLHRQHDDVSKKQIKLVHNEFKTQKPTSKFVVKRQSSISQKILKNVKIETPAELFDWKSCKKEIKQDNKSTPVQKSTFTVKKQSEILRRLGRN